MKLSELPVAPMTPDGYEWDETRNIFVPILNDSLQCIDLHSNPDEFATFLAEMAPAEKERVRLVADETRTVWNNLPFPSWEGWNQEADFVKAAQQRAIESGKASRIWYRFRLYSDGYERVQVIGVEKPEYVYVHKYRPDLYKVVVAIEPPPDGERHSGEKREKPDDERWFSNLARARIAIEEYALCNDWQYFVTLTIDGDKLSRSDLEAFRKKLSIMIRNARAHDGTDIDYLFVPELHPVALKDGRTEWHLHGLMNLPDRYIAPFENRRKYGKNKDRFPPKYIRQKILRREPIFYWKQYSASFGHCVLEPVQNRDASARYLMKYVSKKQGETAQHLDKGQNLYYHSTGLKRAQKEAPDVWGDIRHRAKTGYQRACEHCLIFWYSL